MKKIILSFTLIILASCFQNLNAQYDENGYYVGGDYTGTIAKMNNNYWDPGLPSFVWKNILYPIIDSSAYKKYKDEIYAKSFMAPVVVDSVSRSHFFGFFKKQTIVSYKDLKNGVIMNDKNKNYLKSHFMWFEFFLFFIVLPALFYFSSIPTERKTLDFYLKLPDSHLSLLKMLLIPLWLVQIFNLYVYKYFGIAWSHTMFTFLFGFIVFYLCSLFFNFKFGKKDHFYRSLPKNILYAILLSIIAGVMFGEIGCILFAIIITWSTFIFFVLVLVSAIKNWEEF